MELPRHRSFEYIRPGDLVCRLFAGTHSYLEVDEVDDERIWCGSKPDGWSFDRITGAEIDDELGWGPAYGVTGSTLVHFDPSATTH